MPDLTRKSPAQEERELGPFYQPNFQYSFLAPRYWRTWLGLGLLRVLSWLPRGFSSRVGKWVGNLMYATNKKRKRIARINIDLCFPEKSEAERRQIVKRHFQVYAQCLLDLGVVWWANKKYLDRYIRFTGIEHYQKALEQGRNIILLNAHFSASDIGAAMVTRHFRQIGLIKPVKNKLLDWVTSKGRQRFFGRLFLRERGMRPVVNAIKSGYGFYYLPDEDHGPEKSIFVKFFGQQAAFIPGAAKLIKMCDAVAIPCYTRRLPGGKGYELVLREPLEDFPSGDYHRDTQRISKELEKSIRIAPEQYIWTFKLFKTQPDGKTSPYK